ncbi:MAG: hypothetical protein C3F07_09870 [Anaerolineales bacterium]|nr:hypothetical protein [Anaerolineae bacterium]PWB73406.1 MAG: hypothetical protein C3F07_09870 [Anaerolineales bacterium]
MSDYLYFLPFSGSISFDIEKTLDVASQKWKQDFHIIKSDDIYIIGSGTHQLILALQKESLQRGIVDTLISSYPQWSFEEIARLREHKALISIRTPKTLFKSKHHMALIASVAFALLGQEGAVGFFNATSEKYYPVSHFQKYNNEIVPQLDEIDYLFAEKQNKKR